jgi:hypothetical protein
VASRSSSALLVALIAVTGCDRLPVYAPVTVSPGELRDSFARFTPETDTTISAVDGRSHALSRWNEVELPSEPAHERLTTHVQQLRNSCEPTKIYPDESCELDDRKANAIVFVDTGRYTYSPAWESVGRYALLTALAGGVIAGEVYCFADCDTSGRVALGITDVVVPLVAVIVVFTFIGVGLGAGG